MAANPQAHLATTAPAAEGTVTPWGPALGLLLSLALNAIASFGYVRFTDQQGFTDGFQTIGAMFLFFLVCWPLAGIVHRIFHRSLTSGDRALFYFCLMLATVVPSMGFCGYLFPLLAGVSYFARPDNRWIPLLVDHLPAGLIPQPGPTVTWFYESVPTGMSAPWTAWVGPLTFWGFFFITLSVVSLALMVLMRRQWQEHEHLAYPLAALPLEIIGSARRGTRPLYRQPVFWVGFAVAFGLVFYNGFTIIVSKLGIMALNPHPHYRLPVQLFGGRLGTLIDFDIIVIGVSYLVNTDVLLSVFSFYWLATLVSGILMVLGLSSGEGPPQSMGGSIMSLVQFGALAFMTGLSLWTARAHLMRTWRGLVSDEKEIAPYRLCWAVVIGGLLALWYLLTQTGLSVGIAAATLLAAMVLFLGTTQLLALTGFGSLRAPVSAPGLIFELAGTANLGPTQMAGLGLSYIWAGDIQNFLMGTSAMGLHVLDRSRLRNPRSAVPAGLASLIGGILVSFFIYLYFGYRYGAVNGSGWFLNSSPNYHWGWIAIQMQRGREASVAALLLPVLGMGLTAGVSYLHRTLVWWPVHPAGLVICQTQAVRVTWFSIALAWLLKVGILRYGGPRAYRFLLPAFLGFIAGGSLALGVNFFVKILAA